MQKEQKTYTKEFKIEAVRLLESSQKSQAQIARELGVADSTLSQWRKDLADHGPDAFPGSGHPRRHPQAGLLHHSDRGGEYTSRGYQALLAELGIEASMSRTANCYDNAAMESFFDKLKSECVNRTRFHTQAEARSAIFEYLECFYNAVRLYSTLQYVSPLVYEQAFAQSVR